MRKALPISMIIAVAALGCTMNRTPGNGQPVTATPSYGPATTPGTSYGNNPMSSSYLEPAPNSSVSRADQAAAILLEHQAYQPRFLGYLNPVPVAQQPGPNIATGQYVPPALTANPQITINSSISSEPYPVISSGETDLTGINNFAGVFPQGTTTTPAATNGTNAAATVGGVATATTSVGALSPTMVSGAAPSPIASANVPGQTGMASASTVGAAATPTVGAATVMPTTGTTTTATVLPATAASRLGTARIVIPSTSAANAVPITVSATGGRLMITNAKQ